MVSEAEHPIAAGAPLSDAKQRNRSNDEASGCQSDGERREFPTDLAASAVWAGATPCFWALVRPKPSRLRLGSLPPNLRNTDVHSEPLAALDDYGDVEHEDEVDNVDDIFVEPYVDGSVIVTYCLGVDQVDFRAVAVCEVAAVVNSIDRDPERDPCAG